MSSQRNLTPFRQDLLLVHALLVGTAKSIERGPCLPQKWLGIGSVCTDGDIAPGGSALRLGQARQWILVTDPQLQASQRAQLFHEELVPPTVELKLKGMCDVIRDVTLRRMALRPWRAALT